MKLKKLYKYLDIIHWALSDFKDNVSIGFGLSEGKLFFTIKEQDKNIETFYFDANDLSMNTDELILAIRKLWNEKDL